MFCCGLEKTSHIVVFVPPSFHPPPFWYPGKSPVTNLLQVCSSSSDSNSFKESLKLCGLMLGMFFQVERILAVCACSSLSRLLLSFTFKKALNSLG
ncbi:hypothetical protein CDAR_263401 [Caerostris darwini]|uniref:Uncharacterized protein n=1 Tax=Caerostris darwini TaxID=1538125 RepID=A0AAV4RWA9_9ARAC|nr:hypothetical protein CDAR_263401 [Caerostris darwini]